MALDQVTEQPTWENTRKASNKEDEADEQAPLSSSPRGVLESPVAGSEPDRSSTSSSSSLSSASSSSSSLSSSSSSSLNCEKSSIERDPAYVRRDTRGSSKWKKSAKRFAAAIPSLLALGGGHHVSKRNTKKSSCSGNSTQSADEEDEHDDDDDVDDGFDASRRRGPSLRSFDYSELAVATDNFSAENLIGKGGHAEVYKGRLPDGQIVAIKKLIKKDKEEEDSVSALLSELGIVAHIDHPNAARLLGFSVEGGLFFVTQFCPNGSLASVLHGSTGIMDWKSRFKVAVGVAEGLQYLHHGCQRHVIHRDIKASNILLNADYEPQISDFGLAKWLPEKWTHLLVFPIEGTIGYLAPEYFMHGIVDGKTDVYAFGVLLLELITGRHAVVSSQQSLVMWAKPLLEANNIKELVDPRLGEEYDDAEVKRASLAASMCIHHRSTMRPHMNRVVQILRGKHGVAECDNQSLSGKSQLLSTCDVEDYTPATYLSDLNRHMQLAFE